MLDILLPGLNGYRVCAELRRGGDWTPIVMLTALDEDRARDAGGTGLGPVIVREVVVAHGGSVMVEGASGARFVIGLPRSVSGS